MPTNPSHRKSHVTCTMTKRGSIHRPNVTAVAVRPAPTVAHHRSQPGLAAVVITPAQKGLLYFPLQSMTTSFRVRTTSNPR